MVRYVTKENPLASMFTISPYKKIPIQLIPDGVQRRFLDYTNTKQFKANYDRGLFVYWGLLPRKTRIVKEIVIKKDKRKIYDRKYRLKKKEKLLEALQKAVNELTPV